MKIVCDNCATKYSIADDKVRGKVFKIRCKKCSHIIVVRGGEGATAGATDAAAEADEPRSPISPSLAGLTTSESVWHLVVDREQVGPLTREEIQQKFAAGQIDSETYAWREGFADWLRLGSIEDFKDLASGDVTTANPLGGKAGVADLFPSSNTTDESPTADPADLFSGPNSPASPTGETSLPKSQHQPMAAAARTSKSSSPGIGSLVASGDDAGAATSTSGGKMTGQRNENSVLFSLNNLQALASGSAGGAGANGSSKSGAASATAESKPGFANSQSEGSGLIDIRAMAASSMGAPRSSSSSPASAKRLDDSAFSAPQIFSAMAPPILLPAASSNMPKWAWAFIVGGVVVVAGMVITTMLIIRRPADTLPVVATNTPAVAAPLVPPTATGVPPTTPTQPTTAAPTTGVPATPDKGTAPTTPTAAVREDRHHKGGKGGKTTVAAATPTTAAPTPTAPVAPPPKRAKGGHDELDDLLNGASPDKPKKAAPREEAAPSGGGGDLPDKLDRTAVQGGMSKVKNKVAACYGQYKVPGLASAQVTIGSSGRVSNVSVTGAFAGTPTGDCVEKAVRSASFPAFKEASQTLTYPFILR